MSGNLFLVRGKSNYRKWGGMGGKERNSGSPRTKDLSRFDKVKKVTSLARAMMRPPEFATVLPKSAHGPGSPRQEKTYRAEKVPLLL